ncbi:hypothetical protein [Luteolibacter sp. Populi]|uniref:hypothetical protein n=1 Tax=Luteolibacter sp. Populi TaxID=3230487 RepID=UPI003466A921
MDAPEAAEAYGFKPEKLPAGWAWDDAVAEEVHGILHKHHAPKGLGRELSDFYVKTMESQAREAREVVEGRIAGLAEESRARFAKEWGEDAETRRAANAEFVKARKIDTRDPIVRAALSHPEIVRMIDEARRAAKEVPLAGVDKEVFSGSASPREQAQEIMRGDRNWTNDPVKVRKVGELYGGKKKR